MKESTNKYSESDELLENAADILLYIDCCRNNNSPIPKKDIILDLWLDCATILFWNSEDRHLRLSKFLSDFELILKKKDNFQKTFQNTLKKYSKKSLSKSSLFKIKQLIGYIAHRNDKYNAFLGYKEVYQDTKEKIFQVLKGTPQTEDIINTTTQDLAGNLKPTEDNEVYTEFDHYNSPQSHLNDDENEFISGGLSELERLFMDITSDPSKKTTKENNSALYEAIKKLNSQGTYSEDELSSIIDLFYIRHKTYLSQGPKI